jgi:radical SAM superfamily enzyme YgiQ (UPF0313 family)
MPRARPPSHPPRLLLINPRFPESFWSFRWAVDQILPRKRAVNPPLGLATLAALCPPHWEVEIVDENVESVPHAPRADIVGVCGMGVQHPRQAELLNYYRKRGYFVVAGGSYASLCPERYAPLADAVIAGEAEYIWPRFCADFERGAPHPLYREAGVVALCNSPTPRYDLLKLDRYTTATMQFSRGCPFLCEFCDIIVMFGRKPRYKTLSQVGRELDALRARNVRSVFFVDDNLIGNKPVAKELLRFLLRYQEQHSYPFDFGTEASLNMAQDRELLELFRAARFTWVFIGIESPNVEALKHTRKTQNTQEDILTSVHRIYSYGIDVLAGFIVGFDSDTPATFDQQYRFIRDSGIQIAMVGLLTALPRTPLHERLRREGRLIEHAEGTDNTKVGTNIVPKSMRYEEMLDGYVALYRRLFSDRSIADRVRNKLRHLRRPLYSGEYKMTDKSGIVARLFWKGILRGGWPRLFHFARSLPWLQPGKLPLAILDWIGAISMRNYADRHLVPPRPRDAALAGKWFASFERAVLGYLRDGRASAELSLPAGAAPRVKIRFTLGLDQAFFRRCRPRLERLLRRSRASVMLVVEEIEMQQVRNLQRLLRSLARHGDRISIEISDRLRELVAVDSSKFHLVLERPRAA